MNEIMQKILVTKEITVKEAMFKMGEAGEKVLFVVDGDNRLLGSLTDGDIRRWILKEGSLHERIGQIYNNRPRVIKEPYNITQVKEMMTHEMLEAIPVVDGNDVVMDVMLWSRVFSGGPKYTGTGLKTPVLIMAGGKGARLDPFTRVLPKPLIPIGDKPIVEHILEHFSEFGCKDFYLALNYKGKMIQSYFDNTDSGCDINYIWEDEPYGTAGSIRAVCEAISSPYLFVSNCDILVEADYSDIVKFHKESDNVVTIVGSMKHFTVPYGVLDVKNGGMLNDINEKPEYDFLVSTGLYLINRSIGELIPTKTKCDFTELVEKVRASGGRVGVYPVSQHSWIDVGQWKEYRKSLDNWGMKG